MGVYLKILNFKEAFIRKGRLIERGVYLTNQLSYEGV